jgi:hypothetical protein
MATDGQVWSAHIFIETSALYRNSIIASVVLSNPCITSVFSADEGALILVEVKYYKCASYNKICCSLEIFKLCRNATTYNLSLKRYL